MISITKLEFVEQFKVMLMNSANNLLGILEVSTGCSTATVFFVGVPLNIKDGDGMVVRPVVFIY